MTTKQLDEQIYWLRQSLKAASSIRRAEALAQYKRKVAEADRS